MTRRHYIVPDANLWDAVAGSIRPLHPGPARPGQRNIPESNPKISPPPHPRAKRLRHGVAPPPLTGLDRRTEQRLTRGKVEIDGRIDLHSVGVAEARTRLRDFLDQARRGGSRTVLVITGKGPSPFGGHTLHGRDLFHAPERSGQLRRRVPEWFHEAEFRALIAGFQPAHPKHGGGGAFYVRLRRPR
jgi:DNA-nicking Smr family endonuclease